MEEATSEDVNLNLEFNLKPSDPPPASGWKVRLDHKFAETWNQNLRPRLHQLPDLLPLGIRYIIWWIKTYFFRGIKPFIDMITLNGKQLYGVPLGGIGSGSIGRGFKGEFCRFQMTPGQYTYNVVHANQFILTVLDERGDRIYQKVLSGAGAPPKGLLSSWDWSYNPKDADYHGLYPRAWYSYKVPKLDLKLVCKQIYPVIPHNYTDSSLPTAVFVWEVENSSSRNYKVSLTFTFKNGDGSANDRKKKCSSQTFTASFGGTQIKGVALDHEVSSNCTTYGVGCLEQPHQFVSCASQFNLKTGQDIWEQLSTTGQLASDGPGFELVKGELGVGVCCQGLVPSNQKSSMVFCLTWDQPEIRFPGKTAIFKRRYNRFVDRSCKNADENTFTAPVRNLITTSLSKFQEWDEEIEKWQNSVLMDEKLPEWFKSAVFNELYFISDGGSLWLDYDTATLPKVVTKTDDIRKQIGRFAYLEAHEYRMYNTYDVHFYASFALAMLWPKLQISLQYDFADSVSFEDPSTRTCLFDGVRCYRKCKDSVPHDLGDPCEEPYTKINSYLIHDISSWKDLNLKFVLQVFRDFKFMEDKEYLSDMLPTCNQVMKKSLLWDVDGDGMIENSGSADQTYDSWIMKGTSAYCGSLWIAALFAMVEMLKVTPTYEGKDADLLCYKETLSKAKKAFHQKLWTGEYYKFDCSGRAQGDSIMSDQLCGHWWLSMCGVDDYDVFPKPNVQKALCTIYSKNVLGVMNGEMGAINGMNPDGTIDTYTIQSEETWTGVTYALAATLIHEGMVDEGFKTAEGIYRTVYEKIGMGFETPEALLHTKQYRAIGYMRPLAIWSILHAWKMKKGGFPARTEPT